MPSQREIRRRIGSVGNIKQITRAMQFVAASKLRRAQEATLASRPYSDKLDEALSDVAAVIDPEAHPLLAEEREGKRGRERHAASCLRARDARNRVRARACSWQTRDSEMASTLLTSRIVSSSL